MFYGKNVGLKSVRPRSPVTSEWEAFSFSVSLD